MVLEVNDHLKESKAMTATILTLSFLHSVFESHDWCPVCYVQERVAGISQGHGVKTSLIFYM